MALLIDYNGTSLFAGQPVPFVSKDVDYIQIGETWCQVETITLNGQLTGCSESELVSLRNNLLSNLSINFRTLSIEDYADFDTVKVESISFEDSDYVNIIPYTITFINYPEESFTNLYGVIDVSDETSYTENEDRTLDMVRTISAKGLNTDTLNPVPGNAISNAQSFITQQLADTNLPPTPFIIESQDSDFNVYLVSSQETVDKINSVVSVTQTYRGDLNASQGEIVNRYTINITEEIGEFPRVTYNGQVNAGRYAENGIEDCFNRYNDLKNSISNASYIFDENVTQDLYINQLNYSFSFFSGDGASEIPKVEDDFSVTVSENSNSSLFTSSINGSIRFGYGCFEDDFNLLVSEFENIKNNGLHFDYCKSIYEDFYNTARESFQNKPKYVALNPTPLTRSDSRTYGTNETANLEISYSAEFNDRFIPSDFEDILTFEETISVNPPILKQQISEHYVGGKYSCNDLGYINRQSINIDLNFNGGIGIGSINQEDCYSFSDVIYKEVGTNYKKRKIGENISINEEGKNASYSVSYSDDSKDGVDAAFSI